MKPGATTVIFRIFDVPKAREFYCDYLDFKVVFEHRFEPSFPLYMGIKSGDCEIHLSEHHGDATPGSSIRVHIEGIAAFLDILRAKEYRFMKPTLERMPWGEFQVTVVDPFGNKIIFWEEIQE